MSFSDVTQTAGDSVNLKEVDGTPFTLVGVEDSAYQQSGQPDQPGVKIITKEEWKNANGEMVNKLHTTRKAIVGKLRTVDDDGKPTNQKLHEALANGETYKLIVEEKKGKNGRNYFDLVEAS